MTIAGCSSWQMGYNISSGLLKLANLLNPERKRFDSKERFHEDYTHRVANRLFYAFFR